VSYIETSPVKNSTIMLLFSERKEIKLDPPYQRMGGVWTKEKKQLLMDSILNDYDIPKIYFHVFDRESKSKTGVSYAVIDGRQRLETIWAFIKGKFTLSDDFIYQRDENLKLEGLSYEDIAKEHPRIRIQFDSFVLPVIGVTTDDEDLIEDMFSRLNEAVPLNAAEKRNAIGGDLVRSIRKLSTHNLFQTKVKFPNKRYQHREISARFLFIEDSIRRYNKPIDTKKVYLDSMAKKYREGNEEFVSEIENAVNSIIETMVGIFTEKDELLQAQGNMVIYYLLFRKAISLDEVYKITRRKLIDFRNKVKENRTMAEDNYEEASYELLEYDRLTQQGTNDASNIKERFSIIANEIGLSSTEI